MPALHHSPTPPTDEEDRRSWAIAQMMAAHPELARADVEALYASVTSRLAPAPGVRPAPPRPPARRRLDVGLLLAQAGIVLALIGFVQFAIAPRATRAASAAIDAASEPEGTAVRIAP